MAKQIISGKLGFVPEIRSVNIRDNEHKVLSGTVFIYDNRGEADENGYKKDIPIEFTAWDEQAEFIAGNYEKGDKLTFTAQMRGKEYIQGGPKSGYKPITLPYYVVEKIDPENIIGKQFSKEVISYNKGEIDKFGDGTVYMPKEIGSSDKEAEKAQAKDIGSQKAEFKSKKAEPEKE